MTTKFPFLNIKQKPFELFSICALVLLVLFLIPSKQVFTVNLHDTYFVITISYLLLAGAIIFSTLRVLYALTGKILLSKTLTWIHTVTTIVAVSSFFVMVLLDALQEAPPKRYYTSDAINSNGFLLDTPASFYLPILALIVIGQVLFLINVISGLIHRSARRA